MKKILTFILAFIILFSSLTGYAMKNSTFYYQNDAEWGFENNGRGYCWVTSYAMVLTELTGEKIIPPDVSYVNSLFNEDPALCYHGEIAKSFGMKFKNAISEDSPYFKSFDENMGKTYLNINNDEEMNQALIQALDLNPAGILVRFSSPYYHTIVATHYTDNVIYFNDPAYKENGSNLEFCNTYNGKSGNKLSDAEFIQAMGSIRANISVYLNNRKLDFEVQPEILRGSVMVPMRKIFEELGMTVNWDSETKTAYAVDEATEINITLENPYILKNSEKIPLSVCPTMINSKTFVPVRAVSECLNANVEWDSETNSVHITK